MSEKPDAMTPKKTRSVTLPLRVPEDLDQKVASAAAKIGLSKQDTIRLSLERGLQILVNQLNGTATPGSTAAA